VQQQASPAVARPSRQTLGPRVSQMRRALQSQPRLIEPLPPWQARQVAALNTTPGTVGAGRPSARRRPANDRTRSKQSWAKSVRIVHRLVRPGREDVGSIAPSFGQSVNAKPARSQAVQSRSHKHQSLAMRVRVARRHGRGAQVRVCVLGYEGEIRLAALARSVPSTRWPNPSIERTHNGGAQCLAPSWPVPPLCAAHVKR